MRGQNACALPPTGGADTYQEDVCMMMKPIPPNATDARRVRIGGYANPVPGWVRDPGLVRLGGYLPSN